MQWLASMKGIGAWLILALVLGLNWLALDDITTGTEPDHGLEWTVVGLSLLLLGGLLSVYPLVASRPTRT